MPFDYRLNAVMTGPDLVRFESEMSILWTVTSVQPTGSKSITLVQQTKTGIPTTVAGKRQVERSVYYHSHLSVCYYYDFLCLVCRMGHSGVSSVTAAKPMIFRYHV